MKYLADAWYVAGFASELAEKGSFARTIAERKLLFLTGADGGPRAILDRCAHRFAPLSEGKVCDGIVECPYHGLKFDGDGACVDNPHGPVLQSLAVPAFAAARKHELIWVWLGHKADADPVTIPDLSFIDEAPVRARTTGYLHIDANYELCSDNIMDLTHADYLHADTLGGGAISRTKAKLSEDEEDGVTIAWACDDEFGPPVAHRELPEPEKPASMDMKVRWRAPGVMRLQLRLTPPGRAFEDGGVGSTAAHIMMPETATSTHYFFASARTYRQDDAEFNANHAGFLMRIFEREDKPMLEAQQARMDGPDLWENKPAILPIDAGAVLVRRKLQKLMAASEERVPTVDA